jgi:hypothetical protein
VVKVVSVVELLGDNAASPFLFGEAVGMQVDVSEVGEGGKSKPPLLDVVGEFAECLGRGGVAVCRQLVGKIVNRRGRITPVAPLKSMLYDAGRHQNPIPITSGVSPK